MATPGYADSLQLSSLVASFMSEWKKIALVVLILLTSFISLESFYEHAAQDKYGVQYCDKTCWPLLIHCIPKHFAQDSHHLRTVCQSTRMSQEMWQLAVIAMTVVQCMLYSPVYIQHSASFIRIQNEKAKGWQHDTPLLVFCLRYFHTILSCIWKRTCHAHSHTQTQHHDYHGFRIWNMTCDHTLPRSST